MIRGETKDLQFKIKNGQSYIDGSQYSEVEVQFNPQSIYNSVKKLKSKNEVVWNSTLSVFVVSMSQEDTFKLNEGKCDVQVRLFNNNVCTATLINQIDIGKVLSNEVLK